MTRTRLDNHSTEFGLWLRQRTELDSKDGYIATNIDYMWCNYKNQKWMLLEEKRYNATTTFSQSVMLKKLDSKIVDNDYYGLHMLVFENTNPDDGKMWLDGKEITIDELIKFLRFGEEEKVDDLLEGLL